MFTTILAATDKPALADPSVLTAMQIVKQTNSGLHIMHVLEPLQTDGKPLVKHFQTGQPVLVDSAYKASVREEIIRSYPGLLADIGDFDIAVSVGIPWREILKQVEKSKAELIVMGSCAQGVRGDDCVTKEAGIGTTLEKRLQKFSRAYIEGVDHDYCVGAGVMAHEEILVCAQQNDADILVMGSHTKDKEGKWYAGSAVKRVLHSSKYPLTVLSDPDVLKPWEADATIAAIQDSDAGRTVQPDRLLACSSKYHIRDHDHVYMLFGDELGDNLGDHFYQIL